jgi:voltage-gated potassium channel
LQAILVRLFRVIGLLFVLTIFGTIGYRGIEEWSWADSLYMTVITLSTVGFQEAQPLSQEGRLFTVFLIIAGSGLALYLLTLTARLILEGQLPQTYLRERMAMRIRSKREHVIVGGYGRFGQAVVEELLEAGQSVVVMDESKELVGLLEDQNLAYVISSASSEDGLREAGIEGASAIVAATPSEAENVFITLAAREMNPQIRVHARCESKSAARRLRQAGADQVVSPFQMGGSRTAASILRPAVVDFLEIISPWSSPEVDLEQVMVATGSELAGSEVEEIERGFPSLRVVGLRRGETPIQIAPSARATVEAGDVLLVIGERAPLLDLASRAESPKG